MILVSKTDKNEHDNNSFLMVTGDSYSKEKSLEDQNATATVNSECDVNTALSLN